MKLLLMVLCIYKIPTGGFPSGEELEIAVNLTTPEHSGQYVSYWRMQLPSGEKFGQHVSVFVKVLCQDHSFLTEMRNY